MESGPGFSIEANRRRCLQAAGIAFVAAVLSGLLGWAAALTQDWVLRSQMGFLVLLFALFSLVFGVVAYVRGLDWTRETNSTQRSPG